MEQILVIGAGASGLTAAIFAARAGCKVCILEAAPKPAAKLLATGNGKCNFSNMNLDASCYRGSVSSHAEKMLESFNWRDAVSFMKSIGVLSTDRHGYLYPSSGQASSVVDCLLIEAKQLGVRIFTDCPVKSIISKKDGKYWSAITESGDVYSAKCLIIAAGSYAGIKKRRYKDGILLARSLGLSIEEPLPALSALIAENAPKEWAGVRTEGSLSLYVDGLLAANDCGELQLVDCGISGIPAFQVSRYASCAIKAGKQVTAEINFMPSMNVEELRRELEYRAGLRGRNAQQQLKGMINSKLISIFLDAAGVDSNSPISERDCVELIKAIRKFSLKVSAVNPLAKAQVCAGGVVSSEIDMTTMQAKRMNGLYLAGELLDIDGMCGGYNLHWCWTSGRLAGLAAANSLKRQ